MGYCKKRDKITDGEDVCLCWKAAHPSVVQAREDCDRALNNLNSKLGELGGYDLNSEFSRGSELCKLIDSLVKAAQKLELRSYIHKDGKFSKKGK